MARRRRCGDVPVRTCNPRNEIVPVLAGQSGDSDEIAYLHPVSEGDELAGVGALSR